MNTIGLDWIPFPEAVDQLFSGSQFQIGAQNQRFRDTDSDQMAGVIFPEAVSAWYLFQVLQRLSNPAVQNTESRRDLSNQIFQHMKDVGRSRWRTCDRAVGTDLM